jgi:hypothetical protein
MIKIVGLRFVRAKATWDYCKRLRKSGGPSPAAIYPELRPVKRRWPIPNVEDGSPYRLQALFLFIDSDTGASGMYGPLPGPRRGSSPSALPTS